MEQDWSRRAVWATSLLLFLVAFLPRSSRVGFPITVDELRWIERSVEFVYNLTHGDLGTIVSVHPGVTGTWGFGLFLWIQGLLRGELSVLYQMRADNYYDLPNLLPTAATFTVLVTSFTVVGSFWLLRKLFGARTAFLGALLIAVDPFYLAHSRRVHIDAILASTVFLSALGLLAFVRRAGSNSGRRYLLVSGLFAGLAWLTKLPALFLAPYAVLVLAGRSLLSTGSGHVEGSALQQSTRDFMLWTAMACLVFFALWPSMWVKPGEVLSRLVYVSSWGISAPHTPAQDADSTPMQFFMGRIVDDPGPGYYPLVAVFRLSPVALIFFPLAVVVLVTAGRSQTLQREEVLPAWLGLGYVLGFVAMLSLGAKKLESYILPVFPMVDTLAAVGLVGCLRWLAGLRWRRTSGGTHSVSILGSFGLPTIAIVATSFLWWRLVPYYSTYFNPLLGGPKVASQLFAFGGGEGLDMAASYLNQKGNAKELIVSTAYPDHVFRYQFKGVTQPLRYGDWTGLWLLADYVISYLSYSQRDIPSPQVVDFFETLEPEYIAQINGLEYARVMEVPALVTDGHPSVSHPSEVNLEDKVTFLGYDVSAERVDSGGEIEITLYWQRRQALQADYSVYLRLINGAYHVWGSQDSAPLWGAMPTSRWGEAMVIADKRRLPILSATPPGFYQIAVGMYDSATLHALDPTGAEDEILLGPVELTRGMAPDTPLPQHVRSANLGDRVRLLGYDLEGAFEPGHSPHLTLFWETLAPMTEDFTVFVHLVGQDGAIWGQKDSQPVTGFYPTSRWAEGEFVRDQYDVAISKDAPEGEYSLIVGMYHPLTGQRLPVREEAAAVASDHILLETILVAGRQ